MASNGFRSPVSNNKLTAALVAGFVAWHMATITGYWYRIIDFPNLDWPRFNGILLMPNGTDVGQFVSGAAFHAMTSMCYALIYVYLIHPNLPWPKLPNNTLNNLVKALIWGEILAFFSALLWVPRLFPQFDPGFFTLNFEWKTTVGIFIWHFVWGIHLGAFYNPSPVTDEPQKTLD
jgi:hypothetical protein